MLVHHYIGWPPLGRMRRAKWSGGGVAPSQSRARLEEGGDAVVRWLTCGPHLAVAAAALACGPRLSAGARAGLRCWAERGCGAGPLAGPAACVSTR